MVRVVVGAEDASEGTLTARINAVCQFPSAGEAATHRLGPALDRDVLGRGGGGARAEFVRYAVCAARVACAV